MSTPGSTGCGSCDGCTKRDVPITEKDGNWYCATCLPTQGKRENTNPFVRKPPPNQQQREVEYLNRCKAVAKAIGLTCIGSTCGQGFSTLCPGQPYGEHHLHAVVVGVEKLLEQMKPVEPGPKKLCEDVTYEVEEGSIRVYVDAVDSTLNIRITDEGIIMDLVQDSEVIGTRGEMYDQIVSELTPEFDNEA